MFDSLVMMDALAMMRGYRKVNDALRKLPDYKERYAKTMNTDGLKGNFKDEREKLEAYRNAIGPDMFAALANNPSLPTMIADWVNGEKGKNRLIIGDRIRQLFKPEDNITEQDCLDFVDSLIASTQINSLLGL